MKITKILITLGDNEKDQIVCERDDDFKWTINGPVYPRTIAFLAELNRLAREHDGAGK